MHLKEIFPDFAEFCVFTSSILTSTNKSFGTATIWWISWWSQYFFCIFLEIEASGAQQKKRVCEKKISSDFHGAFEDLYSRFCWILCFYRFYLDSSLLAQFSKFMSVWHLHCHTRQRCWKQVSKDFNCMLNFLQVISTEIWTMRFWVLTCYVKNCFSH